MHTWSELQRVLICSALVASAVLGSGSSVRAQPAPPSTVTVAGSASLELMGHATRTHLAGVEDLYTIALYAKRPFDRAEMLSENAPKALRIEVTYERDWRRPPLVAWHRELVPRLQPAAADQFHQLFAPLQEGDVVLIEYVPHRGTTVHINRSTAVLGVEHDLMLAFLDHWLGQRPVSEDIKQALLGSA